MNLKIFHLGPTLRTRRALLPHPHMPLWHCSKFTLYDLNNIDLTKPYNIMEMKYDQMRQETNDNIIHGQAQPCTNETLC